MITTIWRIIKYGWQGFLRNRWLSVSTIGIMILTLVVFMGLILFNTFSDHAVSTIKDKVDISVYFKDVTSEDEILSIKRSLESFNEVEFVGYVSREEALEIFKERHEADEVITQTLAELDENPLLASLNIKAGNLSDYDTIAAHLESASLAEVVDKVTYAQNELVINRLENLINGVNAAVLVLTIFLAILAIVVTFNTISLAIFSSKEQIGIMRVVGAPNKFIRGPYIVEGIIFGLIAAFVSFLIYFPVINTLAPYISKFVPDFDLSLYFRSNMGTLFLYQVLMGVGLGILSSILAVRRYLRS
ncbi:MAG: permease-like cell division protein FtsX [Candidatus Paceibacterota bacterium]